MSIYPPGVVFVQYLVRVGQKEPIRVGRNQSQSKEPNPPRLITLSKLQEVQFELTPSPSLYDSGLSSSCRWPCSRSCRWQHSRASSSSNTSGQCERSLLLVRTVLSFSLTPILSTNWENRNGSCQLSLQYPTSLMMIRHGCLESLFNNLPGLSLANCIVKLVFQLIHLDELDFHFIVAAFVTHYYRKVSAYRFHVLVLFSCLGLVVFIRLFAVVFARRQHCVLMNSLRPIKVIEQLLISTVNFLHFH